MWNLPEVLAIVLLFCHTMIASASSYNSTHVMEGESSNLIMRLVEDEGHKFIRPQAAGEPTTVKVGMKIVYINDFREADMAFTLELYFRQYWQDSRLAYKTPNKKVTLPGNMADRLWQPDTYFENIKKGELHKLTALNKVMVVKPDGGVFVSTRITLSCLCAMDFRNFPMDRQVCDLNFSSYSFTTEDIIYEWNGEGNVIWPQNQEIAQFALSAVTVHQNYRVYLIGNYSVLGVTFVFTRRIGHYLTRVYIPAVLIVLMSWLSFFVDRSSVPARVSLGITTILTMTTLLIGIGQGSLPVVSYMKAVDLYLIVCYSLVFGAFAEYVIMNFVETRSNHQTRSAPEVPSRKGSDVTGSDLIAHDLRVEDDDYSDDRVPRHHRLCNMSRIKAVLKKSFKNSSFDELARIVFLTIFIVFNGFYWLYYLYLVN